MHVRHCPIPAGFPWLEPGPGGGADRREQLQRRRPSSRFRSELAMRRPTGFARTRWQSWWREEERSANREDRCPDPERCPLAELLWDTRIAATDVGFGVDKGVATLTGTTVSSDAKKLAAREAARRSQRNARTSDLHGEHPGYKEPARNSPLSGAGCPEPG